MITTCLKKLMNNQAVMRRIIQEYEDEKGDLKIDPEIVKDVAADRIYHRSRNKLSCRFSW